MKLNWAERWVVNNPIRVAEQHAQLKFLERARPLAPGFTGLEIGCGRGVAADIIMRRFAPAAMYATDLDPDMLKKAFTYLPSNRRAHIRFLAADGFSLPFKDNSMDDVFCFGVLHHIPDWRYALSEVARVLKDKGGFYFEELFPRVYQNIVTKHILAHPETNRFQSEDLKGAMKDTGLSVIWSREMKNLAILGVAVKNT
ncbi:MAG: class I SAM-dependent methyltransferase [Syntrophorhabdus sp.]